MWIFAASERNVSYSGLLIALVAFLLTRFLVVETLHVGSGSITFLLAGFVPLMIGLGLTVFGVSLAVGAFSRSYVDTVALWCVLGTFSMVVILGITTIDAVVRDAGTPLYESGILVANTLLGGAVGGILIGHRSAENRRQRRENARQADQGTVLNRLRETGAKPALHSSCRIKSTAEEKRSLRQLSRSRVGREPHESESKIEGPPPSGGGPECCYSLRTY